MLPLKNNTLAQCISRNNQYYIDQLVKGPHTRYNRKTKKNLKIIPNIFRILGATKRLRMTGSRMQGQGWKQIHILGKPQIFLRAVPLRPNPPPPLPSLIEVGTFFK